MPDCPPLRGGRHFTWSDLRERRYPSKGREPSNARADAQVCRAVPRPRPPGRRSSPPTRRSRRGASTAQRRRPPRRAGRRPRRGRRRAARPPSHRPGRGARRAATASAIARQRSARLRRRRDPLAPPGEVDLHQARAAAGRRAAAALVERVDQPHPVDRVDDVGSTPRPAPPCWSAAARRSASEPVTPAVRAASTLAAASLVPVLPHVAARRARRGGPRRWPGTSW